MPPKPKAEDPAPTSDAESSDSYATAQSDVYDSSQSQGARIACDTTPREDLQRRPSLPSSTKATVGSKTVRPRNRSREPRGHVVPPKNLDRDVHGPRGGDIRMPAAKTNRGTVVVGQGNDASIANGQDHGGEDQ